MSVLYRCHQEVSVIGDKHYCKMFTSVTSHSGHACGRTCGCTCGCTCVCPPEGPCELSDNLIMRCNINYIGLLIHNSVF